MYVYKYLPSVQQSTAQGKTHTSYYSRNLIHVLSKVMLKHHEIYYNNAIKRLIITYTYVIGCRKIHVVL